MSVIIRLVINYVVAELWESPFPRHRPVVCSRVLDLLQPRMPLRALTLSLDPGSSGPTQAESGTGGLSHGAHSDSTAVYSSSYESKLNSAASTAIRQQFLFALVEERRFFAHLVLRCVRAAQNSASLQSVQAESSSRPVPTEAPAISKLLAQRSGQNPTVLVTELAALQAFWADMACRLVQASRSPGGIS